MCKGLLFLTVKKKIMQTKITNPSFILSEEVRTGKRPKPNPGNNVTRRRIELYNTIRDQASANNEPPEQVALRYIEANTAQLKRYVASRGEQPKRNPVELSVQVAVLRNEEIQSLQKQLGSTYQDAQIYLEQMEDEKLKANNGFPDHFLGTVSGAVGQVAQKGIDKIRADRQAKGKPTKFWDFLSKVTGGEVAYQDTGGTGGVRILGVDVIEEIRKAETKKQLNKILPIAIGGVLILILLTVLITKNAGK